MTIWLGRILTALTGIFMLISGVNVLFIRSADLAKNFAKFGYPESAINVIGWCALIAAIFI